MADLGKEAEKSRVNQQLKAISLPGVLLYTLASCLIRDSDY